MKTWIILPYDDSPAARATLQRAAQQARGPRGEARYLGVLLAAAGFDPAERDRLVEEARMVAGPDVPLEVCLLGAGDPIGDFARLTDAFPDVVLAAPLGVTGSAPWYAEACRFTGQNHALMLFFIRPEELQTPLRPRRQPVRTSGAAARTLGRIRSAVHSTITLGRRRVPAHAGAAGSSVRDPSHVDEAVPTAVDKTHTFDAGAVTDPDSTTRQASS